MEENFATRLKVFMDSTEMTSSQFADLCEIPRPSFSQLLSGRNQKVSDTIIRKIHSVFPDLSVSWLLFGEGDMMVNSANNDKNSSTEQNSSENTPKSLGDGKGNYESANLMGLTSHPNAAHEAIIQQLEESKKIMELQQQIENLQKSPRKVIQVTVYYDDSTYETFIRK